MRINDILQRLKGVKGNGGQYAALCPAHEDKTPSLAISEKDGKILLYCHAGCTKESIVMAMGPEMKDLFIEERPTPNNTYNTPYMAKANGTSGANSHSKPRREIAAIYDYKDIDGNIVHSTIRYNPKSFSQRRPDTDRPGEYIYKDVFKGVTPILYNLQAVTKAIEEHRPIIIVEGEKDRETLAKLGFTATTCPMGAGKWRKEYSDMLTGVVSVYIIADNDETGKNHAKDVAKSLVGKADEIYLIDLTSIESNSDIPQGYDISDLIAATPQEQQIAVISLLIANSTEYKGERQSNGKGENGSKLSGGGKPTKADMLMLLVEESGATFFHSDVKDLYSAMKVNDHTEIMPISSRAFELWLIGLFYNAYGQPISNDAIKQVLGACSAKAMYDNPNPVALSVRVTERDSESSLGQTANPNLGHDKEFWYDLTNNDWQAVKITKSRWSVENDPPIIFNRFRHQSPQAIPRNGGNINKILNYVNLKDNKTLFLCWLVSCFVPNIPHSAIILHGEKGSCQVYHIRIIKEPYRPIITRNLDPAKQSTHFGCKSYEPLAIAF